MVAVVTAAAAADCCRLPTMIVHLLVARCCRRRARRGRWWHHKGGESLNHFQAVVCRAAACFCDASLFLNSSGCTGSSARCNKDELQKAVKTPKETPAAGSHVNPGHEQAFSRSCTTV